MSDDDDPPPRTTTTKKAKKTLGFVVIDDTHPKGIKRVERFDIRVQKSHRARAKRGKEDGQRSRAKDARRIFLPAPRNDGRGGRGVEEANGDASEEEETRER